LNRQGIGRGGRLRAGLATLLALSLLASLALAQTASARTLSERLAVKQAARLMNKQLKDRKRRLVEARVSVGERVSKNRFVFLYDDLNRQGVVCTGTIDVRLVPPGGNKVVAQFLKNTKCARPGDEGLAFRAAARFAGAAFAKKERSVLRSVTRYVEQAQACEDLKVPDSRQDEALLMLSSGLTQATIRPLSGTLDAYAASLQSLNAVDPQLAKGAAAWRDYVDGVRSLPKFGTSYCTVLAEWGANGYTDETAPVDFEALRALSVRLQADGAEVRRTARYLTKLGVDPVTVNAFTLDDLIGNTGLGSQNASTTATLKHYRKLAR
jgi:hypothetical protein